jgi:hypothetical protein
LGTLLAGRPFYLMSAGGIVSGAAGTQLKWRCENVNSGSKIN